MEVSGLAMVQSVGTAGSWSVVARRLISKRSECKAVGVEEGRRESPWLVVPAGCRVLVLNVLMIAKMSVKATYTVSMVLYTSSGWVLYNGMENEGCAKAIWRGSASASQPGGRAESNVKERTERCDALHRVHR